MFDVSSSKPTLLVIDDIPENLTLMYQLLKEDYKVKGRTVVYAVSVLRKRQARI